MAYLAERERYAKIAPWLCLSTLWIAFGLQMLAAFLAPSLMVLAVLSMREKGLAWNTVLRDWRPALWIHTPLFLGLAVYFVWTLSVGAGGQRETPGFGNLAFSFYEFVGFMGLGPPRHVLREQPNLQTFIPYLPWLGIGALTAGALLSVSVFQIIHRRQDCLQGLAVALVTGVSLFVMASTAANFRFWGRHLAPFFPLFSFTMIAAIGALPTARRWKLIGRITVLLLMCVWLVSDARLWTLSQYHKDDYRLAAKAALDMAHRSNGTILWAANFIGGRYYGLEFEQPLEGVRWQSVGRAVFAANWNQKQVAEYLNTATRQAPVVFVLSKPDLYDIGGNWSTAINELRARKVASPNAFNIYIFDKGRTTVRGSKFEVRVEEAG